MVEICLLYHLIEKIYVIYNVKFNKYPNPGLQMLEFNMDLQTAF